LFSQTDSDMVGDQSIDAVHTHAKQERQPICAQKNIIQRIKIGEEEVEHQAAVRRSN